MSTISDVARLSGLSKTTVSRVINNYPHVTKEKRELVLKAMEELSYTPNPSARKMRGQLTTTIGVIVTRIVNPFFSYLVDSIEQSAYKEGYQVVIFQSNENAEKELSYLNLLRMKQVDGIIMTAVTNEWSVLEKYSKYGPIVFCNEYLSDTGMSIVKIDQIEGAYRGTQHLINKGYTKIAYCTGGLLEKGGKTDDRNVGYQKALEEAGLKVNLNWIFLNSYTIEDGKKLARKIFSMKDRPDAVFTGSDEVAAGIIIGMKNLNKKVPEELAVIGFDDQPIAELLEPQLTSIKQPIQKLGEEAVNLIIEQFKSSSKKETREIELPFELIIRQST